MQKDNRFFDDLNKLVSGAAGSFVEMTRELEKTVQQQVGHFLERSNLVTREEFDVVREMAEKARKENEELRAEINALRAPKKTKK